MSNNEKMEHLPGEKLPGPPDRPQHDTQIEEFVRNQHRSKTNGGLLSG